MALRPTLPAVARAAVAARAARLCSRWGRDRDGATVIEFALLVGPFLAVFLAIFETSLFIFSQQSMQTAVENAQRVLMTGQAQGRTAEAFKTALCANMVAVIDCKTMVKVDVRLGAPRPADAYLDANGALNDANFGFQPGGRDAIVTVTAMAAYPLLLPSLLMPTVKSPSGTRLMMASYAFKNEPFPAQ